MGHHNFDGADPEMMKRIEELRGKMREGSVDDLALNLKRAQLSQNIGALHDHPEGRLTDKDDGALQYAVAQTGGKVIVNFGTPVSWIGMNPEDAEAMANVLMAKAREARKMIVKGDGKSLKSRLLQSAT